MRKQYDPDEFATRLQQAGLPIPQTTVVATELDEFDGRIGILEKKVPSNNLDVSARLDAFKVCVEARFDAVEAKLRQLSWMMGVSLLLHAVTIAKLFLL